MEAEARERTRADAALAAGLGSRLRGRFARAEALRRDVEERWLQDLRQYKGVYDPDVAARLHPKRSKAYLRLTRNKVRQVDARLGDLLFPGGGQKNWAIEPTPVPDVGEARRAAVERGLRAVQGREPASEDVVERLRRGASTACERMSREMEDQLAQSRYRETVAAVIHSGNLYGTGVLKGPLVECRTRSRWVPADKAGRAWTRRGREELRPFLEFVPLWDVYPDMEATSLADARYVFQRHCMARADLQALAARPDFDAEAVQAHLRDHPRGDAGRKTHEQALRSMAADGATWGAGGEDRYEVLEYWGHVRGEELAACGCDLDGADPAADLPATVWLLGDRVVKAAPAPLEDLRLPYHFYHFDKDETCIFGEGVAALMRDAQQLFNASVRAMLDNAAIAAGPQVEVNLDLLPENEDPTDLHPFRIWLRSGLGSEAANPAVRVVSLPSHTQEFMAMAKLFEGYADQTAAAPGLTGEGQQAARTARGLSMLMSSASVTLKDQVRQFDDGVTRPFISALYHWNMLFNPRADIKGDFQVQARGWTALVAKELYVEQLDAFAQATANKLDARYIDRRELLRRMAQALDLGPEIVKSDEQMRKESAAGALAAAALKRKDAGGTPAKPKED
jgi:hypothetical protein